MKKIALSVLVFVLLASTMLLFAGCSATKDVENAKTFLEDYFDDLDDEDYEDVLDMFHDELLDIFGGKEATLDILVLRRKTAGEIDEYKIESTEFQHQDGQTLVTFKVKASYEREPDASEEYTILVDGEDVSFYGIDLAPLALHNKLLDDFSNAYQRNDLSQIIELIMPIYFDYATEQDLQNIMTFVSDYTGSFEGYSVIGEEKLLSDIDGKAFALFEVSLLMEHKDMDIVTRLQFCEQDNEIGISFIALTPSPCIEISNTYFNAIDEGNIANVMGLYNEEVFENMEGGAAEWQEYLTSLFNEAGALQQYETTQWYFDEVMMESGLNEEVIIAKNHAIYSNGEILDTIGISFENGVNEILYHYIEPMQ